MASIETKIVFVELSVSGFVAAGEAFLGGGRSVSLLIRREAVSE